MIDTSKITLPDYTRTEDTVNSVTHAVGIPFSAAALILCLNKVSASPLYIKIAVILYAVTMMIMYAGSAVYHGMKPSDRKKIARVADHSNIFVMIAGAITLFYAEVYRLTPKTAIGFIIAIWVLSIAGIVLTVYDQERFKWVQLASYVVLGWSAFTGVFILWREGFRMFVFMILAGAVCLSVGAVVYVVGKKVNKHYVHAVFHVFVLAGTVLHFIGFYKYLL